MAGVLVLGGAASLTATHVMVASYRDTAQRLEVESGVLTQLRADVASYAGAMVTSRGTAVEVAAQERIDLSVRAGFAQAAAGTPAPAAAALLARALTQWVAFVESLPVLEASRSAVQHDVVSELVGAQAPRLLAAIDAAGSASRAATRSVLARNAMVERATFVGWGVLFVLMVALMIQLARRLSAELLQPVGELREAANRLAAGDLTHRVVVGRGDELGELLGSFNVMAEALAGSQQSLRRQASHDSLTGLANRAGFRSRVQQCLARLERREGTQAVLFIDLDDFKDVNDLLGHAAGDELLRVVAERLRGVVRPGDLVARLGGDEFAVLLDGIPDAGAAYSLAGRVVTALAAPTQIGGDWVQVGASVGLSMRRDGSDLDDLMREADVAMYSAKAQGKNRVEGYDATLHRTVIEHQGFKVDIGHAVERDELVLDYQPLIDLSSGALIGVEALVRWQHPTRGLLPPSAFIGPAEDTGAIVSIGTWVLRSAAQQIASWQRRYGRPELCASVNVSVRQLEASGFVELVAEVLASTGLEPGSLVLEVTESVLADSAGGAAEALARLRGIGIRIALDDFGTGYSSIGYLRRLPVDILKIDRSFVSGPQADGPGEALLEAIVGLGLHLGLEVIAEGIEHPEELRRLQALGCATGQGFLLSRPIAAGEIDQWLAAPTRSVPPEMYQIPPASDNETRADTGQPAVAGLLPEVSPDGPIVLPAQGG